MTHSKQQHNKPKNNNQINTYTRTQAQTATCKHENKNFKTNKNENTSASTTKRWPSIVSMESIYHWEKWKLCTGPLKIVAHSRMTHKTGERPRRGVERKYEMKKCALRSTTWFRPRNVSFFSVIRIFSLRFSCYCILIWFCVLIYLFFIGIICSFQF